MVSFKDRIKLDEPRSLEEAIRKLKHCYEQLKRRSESKQGWKGNDKTKGKWDKKRDKLHETSNKENEVPHKKFNTTYKGEGFQFEEMNKGDGRKP